MDSSHIFSGTEHLRLELKSCVGKSTEFSFSQYFVSTLACQVWRSHGADVLCSGGTAEIVTNRQITLTLVLCGMVGIVHCFDFV